MHDTYGKPIYVETTDLFITYYYLFEGRMIVGTYNRRTTQTTYVEQSIPRSLS